MTQLEQMRDTVEIDHIVFPYRDFAASAKSRETVSKRTPNGGLWNATTADAQQRYYREIYKIFLLDVVRRRIPTVFVDFDAFIHSPLYLFEKLRPTFPRAVDWTEFKLAYFQATDVHHRRPPRSTL